MLEGQISHTAWLVMMSHLGLKADKRWHKLPHDSSVAFYNACYNYCRTHSTRYKLLHRLLPPSPHVRVVECMLAFGAPQHFVLRKKAIASEVENALAAGLQQLVVIGAGFDALALDTAAHHPQMQCFELDMPGMHHHKMAIAQSFYGVVPANFHAISADLSNASLHEVLQRQSSYDPSRSTIFVAEGLMMYLPESAVISLFNDIRERCSRGGTIIFSAIEKKQPPKGIGKLLGKLILMISKERFFWSISRGDMPTFLNQRNYKQHYQLGYAELQKDVRSQTELERLSHQNGEYLVCAGY